MTRLQALEGGAGDAKDENKTEEPVVKPVVIRKAIKELEKAGRRKLDAQEAFNSLCGTIAEEAGIKPKLLRAFVTARLQDRVEEKATETDQMQILLDEVK